MVGLFRAVAEAPLSASPSPAPGTSAPTPATPGPATTRREARPPGTKTAVAQEPLTVRSLLQRLKKIRSEERSLLDAKAEVRRRLEAAPDSSRGGNATRLREELHDLDARSAQLRQQKRTLFRRVAKEKEALLAEVKLAAAGAANGAEAASAEAAAKAEERPANHAQPSRADLETLRKTIEEISTDPEGMAEQWPKDLQSRRVADASAAQADLHAGEESDPAEAGARMPAPAGSDEGRDRYRRRREQGEGVAGAVPGPGSFAAAEMNEGEGFAGGTAGSGQGRRVRAGVLGGPASGGFAGEGGAGSGLPAEGGQAGVSNEVMRRRIQSIEMQIRFLRNRLDLLEDQLAALRQSEGFAADDEFMEESDRRERERERDHEEGSRVRSGALPQGRRGMPGATAGEQQAFRRPGALMPQGERQPLPDAPAAAPAASPAAEETKPGDPGRNQRP